VVVFADDPPSSLTAMAFDNATDDAPALQAMLNYAANAGGGDVVVSKPGATYKILSGITIPNGVRYIGPGKRNGRGTMCNASLITSGAAFTVATTQDATPITGLWMDGGMFSPTYTNLTSTYTGISINGVGLSFVDCHLQYFGRGVDLAHNGTFGVTFERCTITRCANGWWGDLEAALSTSAGERNEYNGGSIANCVRGFRATAGGHHCRFACSLDFNKITGSVNNAKVFISKHIETNSDPANGIDYVFEVTGNSQVSFDQCEMVLGPNTYKFFKNDGTSATGPNTYGFGGARFSQCNMFYTDASGTGRNRQSESLITLPAGATTLTVNYPFPRKWTPVSAAFAASDVVLVPNGDQVWVSAWASNGDITVTASASNAANRFVLLNFG
jgi:hypothetical protein